MADRDTAPTDEQVKNFTLLSPMLDSALSEMREFAKRKQDGIVSATKIKILNRLLTNIKEVLRQEDSASYLDLLSEEALLENSDVVSHSRSIPRSAKQVSVAEQKKNGL